MRMTGRTVLATAIAVASISACSPQPAKLDKIEILTFPQQTALAQHIAVSDGKPVTLGPYHASGRLSAHAACLGGGTIHVAVYAAHFTPSRFTDEHGGAIADLNNGCTGRHWGTGFGGQPSPNTYCIMVTFQGSVTDYEVIITEAGGSAAGVPGPTPTVAANPCDRGA